MQTYGIKCYLSDQKPIMRKNKNSSPLISKDQISPWSFYKERQQTIQASIEKRREFQQNKNRQIKIVTYETNSLSPQGKTQQTSPRKKQAISHEEILIMKEEVSSLGSEVKDLIRQAVLLKVISKYMETAEYSKMFQASTHTLLSSQSVNLQVIKHTILEESPTRQVSKAQQQKAFNDKSMQIHRIPAELKYSRIRRASLVRITSRKVIDNEQSPDMEVEGYNKPVLFK